MAFLAPFLLFGGLLVALPIVLHLTRRRRDPIAFPSLRFLKRLGPPVRHRKRKIRNLPLLLLRSFALLLLSLAFARPLFLSEAAGGGSDAPRDVAILVDRSLSMRIGDRATAAREAAAERIAELGPADRAVLVAFDDRPEALTELTGERDILGRALAGIEVGEGGTRFPTALGLVARLLPASPGRRREAVLLSDLQQSGFDDGRPDRVLPAGIGIEVVGVGSPPASPGSYLSSVTLAPEGRDGLAVTAHIGFVPGDPGEEIELETTLWLAGREVEEQTVRLAGGRSRQAGVVRFAPFVRPSEPLAAEVRIAGSRPDWLPDDDIFRFGVRPDDALRVVHLGGNVGSSSPYLREALRVGASPAFLLEAGPRRGEAAVREALDGARIAFVTDPGDLDAGALRALVGFVESGGAAVFGMGPRRPPESWAEDFGSLLPITLGNTRERFPPARLGNINGRHPVFEPFSGGGGVTAALSGTFFYRYRAVVGIPPVESTLARFDDGAPALLAFDVGAGRVALFLSSFDPSWNDLARRPAFVPFLHELLGWTARFEEAPIAWRVGQVVDPGAAFRLDAAEEGSLLIRQPSGETTVAEEGTALRLDQAGIWGARPPEEDAFRMLAVNPPLAEMDPAQLDAEEIRVAVATPEETEEESEGDLAEEQARVAGGELRLDWPLLFAATLLLFSEGFVARFAGGRAPILPNSPR